MLLNNQDKCKGMLKKKPINQQSLVDGSQLVNTDVPIKDFHNTPALEGSRHVPGPAAARPRTLPAHVCPYPNTNSLLW